MRFEINGQYNGDITEYIEDKLSFLNPLLDDETTVSVYIKNEKAGDLRTARIVVPYINGPISVQSDQHRSLTKCIDEIKDKLKKKINRESSKIKNRRNNTPLKKLFVEEYIEVDDE